jgi:hypothetical protein
MGRMVRKQVYIEPRQDALLKQRAEILGVTEAELIRRGIDEVTAATADYDDRMKAWDEMKQYIREHRSFEVPQTERGWTREEIYEERLARFTR